MSEDQLSDSGKGDAPVNGEEQAPAESEASQEPQALPQETEEVPALPVEEPVTPECATEHPPDPQTEPEDAQTLRGQKRKASIAFSEGGESEDFKGFETSSLDDSTAEYSRILDKLEAEVTEAAASHTPLRKFVAQASTVARAKRVKTETAERSRPSSALSMRSEGETNASDVPSSAASSPAARRGRITEPASPLFRVPLEQGWKRELVYRATQETGAKRNADVYYYAPWGKKLRSTREIAEVLGGTGLTLDNFSFFKEPLGVNDPEKEIIRDAKAVGQRRLDSPSASPAPVVVEGKRTPKPKAPKGASPEPNAKTPLKIKVKSVGSRLSGSNAAPAKTNKAKPETVTDNNNSSAWKKPNVLDSPSVRRRGLNGAAPSPVTPASPAKKRRKDTQEDHFTPFYQTSQDRKYNIVFQIFQYLGMRELAQCARVCRLWRSLTDTPALWRHVRMKNSHVSDWKGLCAALKRHSTKRLDLRKILLPPKDAAFWEQFAQHIGNVDTLERLDLCRCPASAVTAACKALPGLRALSALAVRDATLDPTPLSNLTGLVELRLKSLTGLSLTTDLTPLQALTNLQHLSLTSIKELGAAACGVLGTLRNLVTLELGECTFGAEFGGVLARLLRLQRLRLERGTAECAAPQLLSALATLPHLRQLELINFDVKPGFDEALAECSNVQKLLIIPTYVSQSATTNKQVLSGVLRLRDTLTHLMWGVTIELLRVTELFIDQCEQNGERRNVAIGECIPVLKPVPGLAAIPDAQTHPTTGPPQVEILPLPSLQRLLASSLPNTKLKLLKIPFHATWRQSLADFQ